MHSQKSRMLLMAATWRPGPWCLVTKCNNVMFVPTCKLWKLTGLMMTAWLHIFFPMKCTEADRLLGVWNVCKNWPLPGCCYYRDITWLLILPSLRAISISLDRHGRVNITAVYILWLGFHQWWKSHFIFIWWHWWCIIFACLLFHVLQTLQNRCLEDKYWELIYFMF